jgi:Cdc6-like AAA superfamily ATPase
MEFKDWVLQPGATLLCPGIPGAGKTILVSTIVDHLQDKFVNDPDIGVAYIYFNYQRSQEQEPLHLLGSLVRQLTEANGPQNVPANIQALFKNHDDGQQPLAMKDIMAAFTSAIKAYTKVLIILDALDEYQDRLQNLLSTILEVRQADPFSLLATTRPLSAVTIQLPTAKVKEIRADDGDVLSYINSRMGELLSSRISRHPHLQELVRTEVLKATDGM